MNNHSAHIEHFDGGIFRVFAFDAEFGEPYEYALPFRRIDENTIEMVGVFANGKQNNVPLPHQWRAIRNAARRIGLRVIRRRRSGARPGLREVT